MGPAAARTCLRGRLRPHGRRPVPAHCTVSALAPRSRARVVHVRPTRQAGQLRSRERVQRQLEQSFEIVVEVASARERRQSLARSADRDGVKLPATTYCVLLGSPSKVTVIVVSAPPPASGGPPASDGRALRSAAM